MDSKIDIIGLGPGSIRDLSLGAIEKMKNCKYVYLQTEKHPSISYLEEHNIAFQSFGRIYDTSEDFQEAYQSIAQKILKKAKKVGHVVFAVPGHPMVAEETVERILDLGKKEGIAVEVFPAMSFIDSLINSLKIDPTYGLRIVDGRELPSQGVDPKVGNVITQVYTPLVASEVKSQLMGYYKDETMIWIVRAAGVEGEEKIVRIPLYELDRQSWMDDLTSIYIPPVEMQQLSGGQVERLLDIVNILRGENGCPWDREQSHESLKQNLIEEAYEVIDAIDQKSSEGLEEELGDVLLQVVFHAQISKEEKDFDFQDVVRRICEKLIFRHPHIFGDVKAETSQEVLTNWEKIKKVEKGMSSQTEVLEAIPNCLPALMRAFKVQKKAGDVGFDWSRIEAVMEKVVEEWNELKEVYSLANRDRIIEELGDLLFSIVNLARFLKIQPEMALGQTTEKFISRFSYMEKKAQKQNKSLEDMSLEEMNCLWNEAKSV